MILPDGGDCYRAAHLTVINSARSGDFREVVLVHGLVDGNGPLKGVRFGHAWVEVTTPDQGVIVADHSNGGRVYAKRDVYYKAGGVVEAECRRYSAAQAAVMAMSSGHTGPWDEELKAFEAELRQSMKGLDQHARNCDQHQEP